MSQKNPQVLGGRACSAGCSVGLKEPRQQQSRRLVCQRDELTLCVLEVVPPKGTDLVLAAHVPHSEADVFVFHRLHVEP